MHIIEPRSEHDHCWVLEEDLELVHRKPSMPVDVSTDSNVVKFLKENIEKLMNMNMDPSNQYYRGRLVAFQEILDTVFGIKASRTVAFSAKEE